MVKNIRSDLLSRIGCSTLTFRELSLKDALDVIIANGFDHVDLAMIPGWCPHFDPVSSSDMMKRDLVELIENKGLKVSTLNIIPGHLNAGNVPYQMSFIRNSIILGKMLGAYAVTIPSGKAAVRSEWLEHATQVVQRVKELTDFADELNIKLSIEAPHPGTLTTDKESTFRFFELLNDERIGFTFDTSHVLALGWPSLVEAWDDLGGWVNHIHLRDCRGKNNQVTPGKGKGDFLEFFKRISADGYEGDLNIELEYKRFVPFRKSRSLIYRLHRYAFRRSFLRRQFKIPPPHIPTDVKAVNKELIYAMKYFSNILGKDGRHVSSAIKSASQTETRAKQRAGGGKVKVAILGCGWAGRIAHGGAIKKAAKADLVGVCDIKRDLADAASKELTCPAYYDLNDMIRHSSAQIVFNCTREWDHYSTTMKLFDAGIDVFCEKILCARYEDAGRVVEEAKRKGRVLGVNYNYHKLPAVRTANRLIDNCRFGEISSIDISCHAYCFHHALDIALYLGGSVKSVYASYEDKPELRQFPKWEKYVCEMLYIPSKNCTVVLKHSNGVRSCISSSILFSDQRYLMGLNIVFGRARLTVPKITYENIIGQPFFTESKDILYEMMAVDFEGGLQRTFDLTVYDFLSRYIKGQTIEIDGDYALNVMKLEKAIVKSNIEGKEINLQL